MLLLYHAHTEPRRAKKGTLRLLQRAIQLSAHILERDKTQLASQLIGRLFSFPEIEIQNLLECVKSSQSRTWIRPLTPTLTPPDDTLTGTLVGHRGPVQAGASQFCQNINTIQ